MVKRRKFLIGLGSLAAGSAAAMGTGAFTSVEANRGMNVSTVGDASAHLKIEKASGDSKYNAKDSPNAQAYVDDSGDTISINLDRASGGGDGVNEDAITEFDHLLQITNHGTRPLAVWADGLPGAVEMYHEGDYVHPGPGTDSGVRNYTSDTTKNANHGAFSVSAGVNGKDPNNRLNYPTGDPDKQKAPQIEPGKSIVKIGIRVDTTGPKTVDLDRDITIHAVDPQEAN